MLNKIEDEVFGMMEYKHSWTRKEILKWNNTDYIVKLTAQAYSGDDILSTQRDMYLQYVENIDSLFSKALPLLHDYCSKALAVTSLTDNKLKSQLVPKTILFERDNTWGVLFDFALDQENGLAIFLINNEIKVGPQELFL